jgi:hypothetical protein
MGRHSPCFGQHACSATPEMKMTPPLGRRGGKGMAGLRLREGVKNRAVAAVNHRRSCVFRIVAAHRAPLQMGHPTFLARPACQKRLGARKCPVLRASQLFRAALR